LLGPSHAGNARYEVFDLHIFVRIMRTIFVVDEYHGARDDGIGKYRGIMSSDTGKLDATGQKANEHSRMTRV
jgi:hypothetical protein